MINQPSDDNLEEQPAAAPEQPTAADASAAQPAAPEERVADDRVATGDATPVGAQPAAEPQPAPAADLDAPVTDDDTEPVTDAADDTADDAADDDSADESEPEADESEPEADESEPEADESEPEDEKKWYILKVQVNRENSIRDALIRRVKIAGLDEYFEEILVPTEDVAEYNKSGKRRIVKRKLYPGYIMVHMALNDDTWFLVRETPGIGDFTGSAGKPTPMEMREVQRIINVGRDEESGEQQIKTAIPFKLGERVRVKEGNFLNFEGEVSAIDEANGRVTVMINIFGRSTPVELEHWQIEAL